MTVDPLPTHTLRPPSREERAAMTEAADLLNRAADKIDNAIRRPVDDLPFMEATDGPWTTWSQLDGRHRTDVLTEWTDGRRGQLIVAEHTGPDSAYIAAMHPGVGRALVGLLRDHAREAVEVGENYRAVALARVILGETT